MFSVFDACIKFAYLAYVSSYGIQMIILHHYYIIVITNVIYHIMPHLTVFKCYDYFIT